MTFLAAWGSIQGDLFIVNFLAFNMKFLENYSSYS